MKTFRPALFLLLSFLLAALCPARAEARPHQTSAPQWIMTFDDEFDDNVLDTTKWTASHGPMDINEHPLQYFLPEDVLLRKGALSIRSERKSMEGYGFTSGEITTLNKFAQAYGRIVVRCRYSNLPGMWSAVYLLPASGEWPPEIDITEHIGIEPQTIYITNHWRDGGGHQQENANCADLAMDWTKWHTFEIVWQPGVIRWSIDGKVKAKMYTGVASIPMYLRVNTAIGGSFAGEPAPDGWPRTFDVDYIHVYRRADQPAPVLGVTYVPPAPPAPAPVEGAPSAPVEGAPSAPPWSGWDTLSVAALLALWIVVASVRAGHPRVTVALAAIVAMATPWYFLWRIPYISWEFWWIGLPLFVAELFGAAQILGFQYTVWPRPEPPLATGVVPTGRPIFILIPTVAEGRAVVEPTARGALAARDFYLREYPETEVTIALCNDGYVAGNPEWRDMEGLADKLGILCVTRQEGGGAKAGNLEHARQSLGATGESLIVIFDADMAARPEFLLRTIPPFADLEIGWVQTGQYYRNLGNSVARWAHDQQRVFFETICPGKSRLNSAFICGTNVVIRAAALDEIGGLPQESLTEDFAASILLHSRWRSIYLSEVLAEGLGPEDLAAYFSQQRRWAAGTLDVMRREWRRILLPAAGGLTAPQRAQYALSGTHYLCGLGQIVFFLCPIFSLLLGVSAITSVSLLEFLRHFAPFWVATQLAHWYACGRKWRWRGAILAFASAPILAAAFASVLMRRPGRFVVTAKERRAGHSRRSLAPHFWGLALSAAALIAALANPERVALGGVNVFWLLYSAAIILCVVYLAVEARVATADAEASRDLLARSALPTSWSLGELAERRRRIHEDDTTDNIPLH
ncbi:MAG: family 16 glycosylhydrolase [Capsulimonas sp.]|uniref:family 16 glycosylhydrolase n=1 Tax=Capsulimonas sp. TaxID=2494211 RepID=UPI003262D4CD